MSNNNIVNKETIPEFGMQTFENKVNPTDLIEPSPSILDTILNLSSIGPAILFGAGMIMFLFSVITGRPNWSLLGMMIVAAYVISLF